MREWQDLLDLLPYCLLVALPVFIALSPMPGLVLSATDPARRDFPVHRLAHFELGGSIYGSKSSVVSMDARSAHADASHLLRKVAVAKIHELSTAAFDDLVAHGTGAILLLLPGADNLTLEERESVVNLEYHLLSTQLDIPVYFTYECETTRHMVQQLEAQLKRTRGRTSAAQIMLEAVISTGYQLATSSMASPKPLPDATLRSAEALFKSVEDSRPTVVVVSHYDALGAAPTLSYGADANGSGVIILMELARIFRRLYESPKTRPPLNLLFLLSAGGKMNYLGSKKWLEERSEDGGVESLSDLRFALCLDTLGDVMDDDSTTLYAHVSKPPKDDSYAGLFLSALRRFTSDGPQNGIAENNSLPVRKKEYHVKMVHKKINLGDQKLAWEHERFSIKRLPALTLSRVASYDSFERTPTILDTRRLDASSLARHIRLIGEALACVLYDGEEAACNDGRFLPFVEEASVQMWSDYLHKTPRFAGLMAHPKEDKVFSTLLEALRSYAHSVRVSSLTRDKREPEFNFYDQLCTTMSVFEVKPAPFDLFLSLGIASYLLVIYVIVLNSNVFVAVAAGWMKTAKPATANGHTTNNGVLHMEKNGRTKTKAC